MPTAPVTDFPHAQTFPVRMRPKGLADEIVALMAEHGVSLADLLEGLQEERKAIWVERNG